MKRKQAAEEIFKTMVSYEHENALSYNTIYRMIYRYGDRYRLTCGINTSHYDYTV